MFFLVVTKSISWGTYVGQFFLPSLLGNVVGGLALVAALGHAQVVGRKEEQKLICALLKPLTVASPAAESCHYLAACPVTRITETDSDTI